MFEEPEVTRRLKVMAQNVSHLSYTTKRNGLLALSSSSEEEEIDEYGRKIKVKKNRFLKTAHDDDEDKVGESIMMEDPNKLDLINHLNSMKLLQISDAFDHFPKG